MFDYLKHIYTYLIQSLMVQASCEFFMSTNLQKKKETQCPISVWYHIYHQHNNILTNSDKDKTWIIHYVWIQIGKIKVTAYNIITLFHQYFSVTDLKINIFRLESVGFFPFKLWCQNFYMVSWDFYVVWGRKYCS